MLHRLKNILVSISLLFILNTCFGQYSIIKLHYEAKDITDTFPLNIYNAVKYPLTQFPQPLLIDNEKLTRNGKENTLTAKILTGNIKTAIIGNGLGGSEIFIGLNDTIEINITKVQDGKKFKRVFLVDSMDNYKFFNFKYINKNQIIHQFFDSLAYIAGQININDVSFFQEHYDINMFFRMATLQYRKRINYLDSYNKNHQMPEPYSHYAYMEIKSAYIFNLLTVFLNANVEIKATQLSQQYLDSIKTLKLDDEDAFFNTIYYKAAVLTSISTILNDMDYPNYYSDVQLKNRFESIDKHFTGDMHDYLLTSLLAEFYKKKNTNYDSLVIAYHSLCKTPAYIYSIDSIMNTERKRKLINEKDAFKNSLTNYYGKTVTIKNLINNKPIVIDCWASWCEPCIRQMGNTKTFEKKYGDKIDFIFLSFDKNKESWINKVNELALNKTNCYLLSQDFKSIFAHYFDINSIPRYILIDRTGKVVSSNSIRPSHQKEFETILKKLIAD